MYNLTSLVQPQDGWQLFGAILALAVLTIALLQLIDNLFPVRSFFNDRWLRDWIKGRVEKYQKSSKAQGLPSVSAEDAYTQMVAHATGGNLRAFLGLPPAQLVAQVNAAAQIAMESPKANLSLLVLLAQPTDPGSVRLGKIVGPGGILPESHADDLKIIYNYDPQAAALAGASPPGLTSAVQPSPEEELKTYLAARNRIAHLIQRNLDSMQIAFSFNSSVWNQSLTLAVSFCIAVLLALYAGSQMLIAIFVGVLAGYVAPILGDVVTAIQKLGRT